MIGGKPVSDRIETASKSVMAGLDRAIHAHQDVDPRDKPGDGVKPSAI